MEKYSTKIETGFGLSEVVGGKSIAIGGERQAVQRGEMLVKGVEVWWKCWEAKQQEAYGSEPKLLQSFGGQAYYL